MKRLAWILVASLAGACQAPETAPGSNAGAKETARRPDVPLPMVREVQRLLVTWGYRPGPVDGIWRDESEAALKLFAADWELPEPRGIPKTVIAMLRREDPRTRAQDWPLRAGCKIHNPFPAPRERVTWTGPCRNGLPHGSGTLTWSFVQWGKRQKQVFRGTLVAGKRNGRGVQELPNGASYAGTYRNDLREGDGVLMTAGGTRYEGGFHDDRFHGAGILNYSSGDIYVGEFREGLRHGRGRFQHTEGTSYEGAWEKGLPHGRGTLSATFAERYSGIFDRGCHRKRDGSYISFLVSNESCAGRR